MGCTRFWSIRVLQYVEKRCERKKGKKDVKEKKRREGKKRRERKKDAKEKRR